MSHGKEIFDHALNALSALLGSDTNNEEAPTPPRSQALKSLVKAGGFGAPAPAPSCCIAKRTTLGAGKLSKMRDPGSK